MLGPQPITIVENIVCTKSANYHSDYNQIKLLDVFFIYLF